MHMWIILNITVSSNVLSFSAGDQVHEDLSLIFLTTFSKKIKCKCQQFNILGKTEKEYYIWMFKMYKSILHLKIISAIIYFI